MNKRAALLTDTTNIIIPTREQVCKLLVPFQGYTYVSKYFGPIQMWGPEVGWLPYDDALGYYNYVKRLGFTHVEFALTGKYDEPNYSYPVKGRDFTNSPLELIQRIKLAIESGLRVALFLGGDGHSIPGQEYNDPNGWTKGYEWLYLNLDWILGLFKDNGLYKHILFVPGYDGVFYGWEPSEVNAFGKKFRSLLPDGYLGLEFNSGHIPCGEGGSDYQRNGLMQNYDSILGEFNWPVHDDTVWQIVARLGFNYHRPTDQPVWDDTNPPYYLNCNTPRGRFYFIKYEYATYQWVRKQVTADQVQSARLYLDSLSEDTTC